MNSKRDDAWILTYTGREFWPLDPRAEDVFIEDIAHALALTCRFTGHCREFYSVAQHSVLCSHYVADHGGDTGTQLAALLHDASEAYLPDVARPIKDLILVVDEEAYNGRKSLRKAEDALLDMIITGLHANCYFELSSKLLKRADVALLLAERRDLLPAHSHDWAKALGAQAVPPWKDTILPWSPMHAEERFLAEFARLMKEVRP